MILVVERHRGVAEGGVAERCQLGAHHVAVGTAVDAVTAVQERVHPDPVADVDAGDVAADRGDGASGFVADGGGQVLERAHFEQAHDARGHAGRGDPHDDVERPGGGDGDVIQDKGSGVAMSAQGEHRGHERTSTLRVASRSGETRSATRDVSATWGSSRCESRLT